jgi:hypothetical protein
VGEGGETTVIIDGTAVDKGIDQALANGQQRGKEEDGISLVYDCSTVPKNGLNVKFPRSVLARLKEAGVKRFTVRTKVFWFSFDATAIADLLEDTKGNVTVHAVPAPLSEAAARVIGDRPAFDVSIRYERDGHAYFFPHFSHGEMSRGFAYKPTKEERAGCLYIVYVDPEGTPWFIQNSSYREGWVIWTGQSCSVYGVGYKTPTPIFTDVDEHWAKDDIAFAASRELISNADAETFSPDAPITRKEFLVALGKLSGTDVREYTTSGFADVPDDDPAMPYIAWTAENGVAWGMDGGRFEPDKAITREEAAVILERYSEAIQYTLPRSREATDFADTRTLGAATRDIVTRVQQAGLLRSEGKDHFDPKGPTTRAEASAILRRFVELIVDESTARGHSCDDAGQPEYYDVQGWLADN